LEVCFSALLSVLDLQLMEVPFVAAIDFFSTEIYTLSGLTRYMVLVSIHIVCQERLGGLLKFYRRAA
jgi:hypothetical protein